MSNKKQRAVYLDDESYDKAVEEAKKQGRSFNSYVEQLIKLDIEKLQS